MTATTAENGGPLVHKFGGSCLSTPELTVRCSRIATDAFNSPRKALVVVSALKGQTHLIREMLDRLLAGGNGIDNFMEEVRARHQYMAQSTIMDRHIRSAVMERVETLATRLERLLYGVIYTEELTPRSRDQAMTHGERMSAHIFSGVLADRGATAIPLEADTAGVITDGVFGSATADIGHLPSPGQHHQGGVRPGRSSGPHRFFRLGHGRPHHHLRS